MAFCDIGPDILFIIAIILFITGAIGLGISYKQDKDDNTKNKWKIVLYSGVGIGIFSYVSLHACGRGGSSASQSIQ